MLFNIDDILIVGLSVQRKNFVFVIFSLKLKDVGENLLIVPNVHLERGLFSSFQGCCDHIYQPNEMKFGP